MTEHTIAGQSFDIPRRYEEGHVMNAHEAWEADQRKDAKLCIAYTKKIKARMTNGKLAKADHEALQKELNERGIGYEAGIRYRDPSQKRAKRVLRLARRYAKASKAIEIGRDEAAKLTVDTLDQIIADNPLMMQLAEQQIAQ